MTASTSIVDLYVDDWSLKAVSDTTYTRWSVTPLGNDWFRLTHRYRSAPSTAYTRVDYIYPEAGQPKAPSLYLRRLRETLVSSIPNPAVGGEPYAGPVVGRLVVWHMEGGTVNGTSALAGQLKSPGAGELTARVETANLRAKVDGGDLKVTLATTLGAKLDGGALKVNLSGGPLVAIRRHSKG
jgi:hypothetical protein